MFKNFLFEQDRFYVHKELSQHLSGFVPGFETFSFGLLAGSRRTDGALNRLFDFSASFNAVEFS